MDEPGIRSHNAGFIFRYFLLMINVDSMQTTNEMPTTKKAVGAPGNVTARKFRVLVVVTLVILAIQGWFGDTVNLFVVSPNPVTPPPFSFAGFIQLVQSSGVILEWHSFEGILLMALSIAVLALSFKWSRAKSVRISAILGTFMIFSAALGGYLFVLSGFANGGNSAQMGGSFIGAFAFYFIALYYAK